MAFHPSRALRASALLLLLTLLALLAFSVSEAAAAAKCKSGTKSWKVNGRHLCLKTAKAAPGHAAVTPKGQLGAWFDGLQPPKLKRGAKLNKKLISSRTRKRTAAAAAKLLVKAQNSSRTARAAAFAAATGDRGEVVERLSEDVATQTTADGVTITAHVDGTAYADGSKTFDLAITASAGGDSIKFQPVIETRSSLVPEVECPTADGRLTIEHEYSTGGTYSAFRRGKLLGAVTQKITGTLRATGQVGRDARLQSVRAQAKLKVESYSRGKQIVVTSSGDFSIPREGNPVPVGALKADVSMKVAGASRRQERAAENAAAKNVAADPDSIASLAASAEVARWRMKTDEYKWYDAPFRCADIRYNPDSIASLAAGASMSVAARVVSRDGGEGAGSIAVESVSRGSLSVVKAELDPGSPAQLKATGAAPDADKITVGAELIAASTAGRAGWGWYARDELDLPKKISGVVESWTEVPGAVYNHFHSWVVYTLKNVYVSENGYVSAFYDLTRADQDEVENTIGGQAGCRYVAKASGGEIAAGDLELRKPPGGSWQHAIMYDVEVAEQLFKPTDCGPAPPPAFTGDVVGFLNMTMLGGSGFYPVEDGFHFQQTAVTHTDPASGRKTTADWILDPGDPQ